jgi:hypothetical protein
MGSGAGLGHFKRLAACPGNRESTSASGNPLFFVWQIFASGFKILCELWRCSLSVPDDRPRQRSDYVQLSLNLQSRPNAAHSLHHGLDRLPAVAGQPLAIKTRPAVDSMSARPGFRFE